MNAVLLEARFALRERTVLGTLIFAFAVSVYTVVAGLAEVNNQHQEIRVLTEQTEEDQQYTLTQQSDAGSAAYYVHHFTYQAPSELAFAAAGTRQELPWKHRLRMLALEGQIYETDIGNAGLSSIGRLDFAFLISILLPLLLILLLYDLDAREHRKSRYELLIATSQNGRRMLFYRALARTALLFLAVCTPFVVAALLSGAPMNGSLIIVLAVALHLAFWQVVCRFVSNRTKEAPTIAVTLLGAWLFIVAVVPAVGKAAIEALVPVPEGGQILLAQREAVNDAWDLPKEATMSPFLSEHPEWRETAAVDQPFEWKWYYAFQQVGDQTVTELSTALRDGIKRRDNWMRWVAVLSPSLATQRWLTRIADTDLSSHLRYNDCARKFHAELRAFHYPMLFGRQPYSSDAMQALPKFSPCEVDRQRGDV